MNDHEPRWTTVNEALDRFRSFLSPSVAANVKILKATRKDLLESPEYNKYRPAGFPSGLCGVYLMYGKNEELLYVGLARVSYDKRVWTHDKDVNWHYLDIIPFEGERLFLASALEEFLINACRPAVNRNMKR